MARMACEGGGACRGGGAMSEERKISEIEGRRSTAPPAPWSARPLSSASCSMLRTAGELHDARRLTSSSMVCDPRRRDSSLRRRGDSTFSPCLAPTPADGGAVVGRSGKISN
jgi:hypothetical protein